MCISVDISRGSLLQVWVQSSLNIHTHTHTHIHTQVEPGKVTAEARFKEDLSLDSLDVVEVVMAIEEEFALEIPDNEADKIVSISDAVKYIAAHPQVCTYAHTHTHVHTHLCVCVCVCVCCWWLE